MEQITVVGAGVMGKGIAYACAISGYKVYVNDINDEILAKAKQDINQLLDESLAKGFINQEVYEQSHAQLNYDVNLEQAAKDADLVIEAVLEKMDLKVEVFKQLYIHDESNRNWGTNIKT
mgnify:CR=1 FL=1